MKKSIYSELGPALKRKASTCVSDSFQIPFSEIEQILGRNLPPTAYGNDAWWANNPAGHSQAKAWLEAGFKVAAVDRSARTVRFTRIPSERLAAPHGMEEQGRHFRREEPMTTPRRHPAFGALKGTFTIAPGTDLTAPVYTDEEWAEIEKEMEADWDEIERGMKGQK